MRKRVVIVGRKNSPIYEEEKSSRTRLRVKKKERNCSTVGAHTLEKHRD